jgi:hypothetical protein
MDANKNASVFFPEQIEQSIVVLRGQKALLSTHLADFYGVEAKKLIQQVKRNSERFPEDFMFKLSSQEWSNLKSQIATSSSQEHGGLRKMPYAFTEQGVAMLSSVIRSKKSVEVNIEIDELEKELAEVRVKMSEKLRTIQR